MSIYKLHNAIQHYDWGSYDAIPQLMGLENPERKPVAELWMGAHPKAPSSVIKDQKKIPLNETIASDPAGILGQKVAARFDNILPFLFKLLSAAKPLSIQAHPNLDQAESGFDREEQLGIPLDAPNRNYKDRNHKPEIICALTPFTALRGFRAIQEIIDEFVSLDIPEIAPALKGLREHATSHGLRDFFKQLMEMESEQKASLIHRLTEIAPSKRGNRYRLICSLAEEYPSDIGVVAPLLLNLIQLNPGEAMFLPAGELHAYLEGTGIELMANSDNVLRGGLTSKHVDIPELLNILSFSDAPPEILHPRSISETEETYPLPINEFLLTKVTVRETVEFRQTNLQSIEIYVGVQGAGHIRSGTGETLTISKGDTFTVFAETERYSISGNAVLYRASVPI